MADVREVFAVICKGAGYAELKNLSFTADARASINQVAEFMFPLKMLDDEKAPRVWVDATMGNQGRNRKTVWLSVQLREMK